MPLYPVSPVLGVLFCLYLMYGTGWTTWVQFAVFLAVGSLLYMRLRAGALPAGQLPGDGPGCDGIAGSVNQTALPCSVVR